MSDRRQILGPLTGLPAGIARQMKQVRFNPIRHCTPATLARDLDSFEAGYLRNAALLWEAIEQRDDMVCPTANERRSSVSARKFEVVTVEKSEEAEAHKEALEYCLNHLTVTDALDLNVKGTFSDLVEQMMGAMLHRYAVHEIIWKPGKRDGQGRPAVTAELKFCPLYLFENTTGRLGYTGPLTSGSEGTPLSEDGWMITCGDGIMRAVSVAWMFKRLSLTDWLNFSEKFGVPGVHGTTNATYGSDEWNKFVDALEKFANDWIMASAQGSEVKLIEAGKTGEAPFKPMVERMDRAITILLLGSDLATLSRDNATGASLQNQTKERRLARDCERMSSALQVNVGRPVIELLFGEGTEPLAYIQIPPPKQQDINQDMSVDKHLRSLGVPMSEEDVLERYGRTRPSEGETLLQPPQQQQKQPRQDGLENERRETRRQDVSQALVDDLQAVRDAIATALRAGDGNIEQALQELDAKMPDILTAVMQGDALEQAFEAELGSAFVAGLDLQNLVETTLFDNANPYRDEKGRFTSKANAITDVVTAALDPSVSEAVIEDYHVVSAAESQKLQQATGLNLSGYTHALDNYSVKHILKAHGDAAAEAMRGQLPVTAADFAHLPEIVTHWDSVQHGGTTKQGRETLLFTKTIGDTMYLVEEVRTGKKKLVPVTLYKRRAAPGAP